VLPISYRLIVLDTALLVKKSLNILNQNGKRVHASSRA
jgi:5'-AMP-activated protein kinase regulatory gamma subunit